MFVFFWVFCVFHSNVNVYFLYCTVISCDYVNIPTFFFSSTIFFVFYQFDDQDETAVTEDIAPSFPLLFFLSFRILPPFSVWYSAANQHANLWIRNSLRFIVYIEQEKKSSSTSFLHFSTNRRV